MSRFAPLRLLIDNGTEAARAVSAAYVAAERQLPPLPSQLAASACFFWLLLCAAAVATLLLLLRAYLDGGGVIPLSSRCVCRSRAGEASRARSSPRRDVAAAGAARACAVFCGQRTRIGGLKARQLLLVHMSLRR